MTFPSTVDEALQETILDWFKYREVCDDEKFPLFFRRELNASMRKYNQLLRIEPGQTLEFEDGTEREVTYDWMIQHYHELMSTDKGSGSSSKSLSGSNTLTKNLTNGQTKTTHMTGEDDTDRDTTGSNTTTRNTTDKTDGSVNDSGTTSGTNQALSKASPQSISYATATGGFPSALDWSYPGAQEESKQSGANSSSGTSSTETKGTGTISDNGSGTEDVKFNTERETTETIAGTNGGSETASNTGSENGTNNSINKHREISSGRDLDPATLLQRAKDIILGSSAWNFLYGRLDTCFQCVIMEW